MSRTTVANRYSQLDRVSAAYVRAALRLGADHEGFVDAYFGPESLEVEAGELGSAGQGLSKLEIEISGLEDGARKQWFEAQLTAMQELHEESEIYADHVQRTYGVRPKRVADDILSSARSELNALLPGSGALSSRFEQYYRQFDVDPELALRLVDVLSGELQAHTRDAVDLPKGESAEFALVSGQPWSGYNWYLGNFRSRIEINTDLPLRACDLPDLVAHEVYCGHHTEQVIREQRWMRSRGWGEASIALLNSPEALTSEGIATCALDLLVPLEQRADWLHECCFDVAGIDVDAERLIAIERARLDLTRANGNAALMIHQDGSSEHSAVDYLVEVACLTRWRAEKLVQFITTPALRGYIFNYTAGYDIVRRYIDASDDGFAAFRSLLEEHWTSEGLSRTVHETGPEGSV